MPDYLLGSIPSTPRRRADALQNREKILDAAEAVLLDLGSGASLDLIAERAGVGRATLFRNFPDRTLLIASLLERFVTQIEKEAALFGDDAASWDACCTIWRRMSSRMRCWPNFG